MFGQSRQKTELTEGEFRELLTKRIRDQLGMTLDDFLKRQADGTLPDVPGCAEIDVLVGERESSNGARR